MVQLRTLGAFMSSGPLWSSRIIKPKSALGKSRPLINASCNYDFLA